MKETGTQPQMERLLQAVQELSLARSLDSVMHIVRTVARELTGADGATFILRRNGKCYYADEDAIGPLWKGQEFPMEQCISGWAMLHRQPVVIEDIYADDRVPQDVYRPTFVKSLAMVPIRTMDPIGAIGTYWAHQYRPSAEEIKLLQAMADITVVTLENINMYNDLEQRVKDRTAELEASNQALDAFTSSISHDLRAPLRKIGYFTELLTDNYQDKLDEKGRGWMVRLRDQSRDMSQLIDVLLEFSRTGKKALEKTMVPMQDMAAGIAQAAEESGSGRSICFTIHNLPDALADTVLIRQVWVNLISNAVKYTTPKEKAEIDIGAEEKNGAVIYHVRDNGVGFDMGYADKLFTPFQRLHSPAEFEGTGIGLATVERIVTKHGGKVWVEAKPDEGACFYFQLPKN